MFSPLDCGGLCGQTKVKAATVFEVSLRNLQLAMRLLRGRQQEVEATIKWPMNKAAKLQEWQTAKICNMIRVRHPEQMKLSYSLWNARSVRGLKTQAQVLRYGGVRYQIRVPKRTFGSFA